MIRRTNWGRNERSIMLNELPRLLTIDELGKLPTHRILAYKKKYFRDIGGNYAREIKELLNKREHVQRKVKK